MTQIVKMREGEVYVAGHSIGVVRARDGVLHAVFGVDFSDTPEVVEEMLRAEIDRLTERDRSGRLNGGWEGSR